MVRLKELYILIIFLTVCLTSISYAQKPEISFHWPVDCSLNQDCWVVNYVDVNPAKGQASDFKCSSRTYDAHKGTDITVLDYYTMEQGVDVYAVADGVVLGTHTDMADTDNLKKEALKKKIKGKECGNGVTVTHENGWQTRYCHMKKDSIVVQKGYKVTAGQKIGQVGQSGFSEFPHLHFGVSKDGKVIDPFTNKMNSTGCSLFKNNLWQDNVEYNPVSLYRAGFSSVLPKFQDILYDTSSFSTFSPTSPLLAFWFLIYGAEKGDVFSVSIIDSTGRIFIEQEIIQEKRQARSFYYVGKKNSSGHFQTGKYKAHVKLTRKKNGKVILEREISSVAIVE